MFSQHRFISVVFSCLLSGGLVSTLILTADSAKKYYPPGFSPPEEAQPAPQPTAPSTDPVPPSQPNVLIKRVPVKPKPIDPLTTLLDEQRYYEALRLLDKRIEKSPKNLSLQILKAQILRKEGSFDKASETYQNVLEQANNASLKASALNGLGWTYYAHALQAERLGDTFAAAKLNNQAEANFKQALQIQPKLLYSWLGLAQWAISAKNAAQAEVALAQARKLDHDNTLVLMTQAELLLIRNKPQEALPLIYKARQQAPKDSSVLLALGKTSLALGKPDDAIIQLKLLLEMDPDNPEGLRLLSSAYEKKMQPADAEQALQKALALNPGDVEAAKSLLKIYDQTGEPERGITFLKQLSKQQPDQHDYQGELLTRLNRAGEFEEAYRLGQGFIAAAKNMDNYDMALQAFSQAVFQHGKGMLDRAVMLKAPAVEKTIAYYQGKLKANPQDLDARLQLLLINPLATLPAGRLETTIPTNMVRAVQIAFLQGDSASHQKWLTALQASKDASLALLADTSRQLLALNDFSGATVLSRQVLAAEPGNKLAQAVQQDATKAQTAINEHLQAIKRLSGKLPEQYWQQAISSALDAATGHWQIHAELSERLADRNQYGLAYTQQLMAARYATEAKTRQDWLKRAERTRQRRLKN